jgi:hypothetical protein
LGKTIDEGGGEMAAHLNSEVGEDYARQITAEEKRIVDDDDEVWVQLREDNHYLDCEVLAMECVESEWPGGGVNLVDPTGGKRPRKPRKPKTKKEGRW